MTWFVSFIVLIILAVLVILFLSRYYRKATREVSVVRTGAGGQRIVLDGGCIALPFLHKVAEVNMRTTKLEIERLGASTASTISPPLGVVRIGAYSISGYELFLIAVTAVLLLAVWLTLRFTRLGLLARGTMQNAQMASALGVSTSRIYMITFGLGAAVTGLAGGLLAPITGVLPTIGATYIAKAFITVISGGASILAGTAAGSVLLGGINGVFTFLSGPTYGEVALLLTAIVLLRLMPRGITGRFFRKSL